MKKIILFGLAGAVFVTSANAGWLDKLGFGKKSEPATLEEACNKDEITSICPDIVLGDQTMLGCLTENISSLSDQCATFVKKATVGKVEEAKGKVEAVKTENKAKVEAVKAENKAKLEAVKAENKAKVEDAKAKAKAKTDEAKNTKNEIKDSAKQTGKDVSETGKSLKNMF